MTYIKNNKTLLFIIAILLISNLALVFFFMKNKGHRGDENRLSPREFMIKTFKDSVGFDDAQIKKYEQLSDAHKKVIKPLFDDIRKTKDSLYSMLKNEQVNDSAVTAITNIIGEKQASIDYKIFTHFRSLREIATANQQPMFDTVMERMVKRMTFSSRKEKPENAKSKK